MNHTETVRATTPATRKYRQAAVFYLGYGVLYLAGTLGQARVSGWRLHGYAPAASVVFLIIGAAITVVFPYLIWRELRWFTRVLAVVVFGRAAWLFQDLGTESLFLAPFMVAAATAWMLARAGWDL